MIAAFGAILMANLATHASGSTLSAEGRALVLHGNAHGVPACSACHGLQGQGEPAAGFPRLAGLPAVYIEHELASFANGSRESSIMVPNARALTAEERSAVGAYFSGANAPKAAGGSTGNQAAIAEGEQIANRGDWPKGLPACDQCHGRGGVGVGAVFPPLAGQSALYIANQLRAWRSGQRRDDPMKLMEGVAKKLTNDQITVVAAYFASLPLNTSPSSSMGRSTR